jgi:hypothetical protein
MKVDEREKEADEREFSLRGISCLLRGSS